MGKRNPSAAETRRQNQLARHKAKLGQPSTMKSGKNKNDVGQTIKIKKQKRLDLGLNEKSRLIKKKKSVIPPEEYKMRVAEAGSTLCNVLSYNALIEWLGTHITCQSETGLWDMFLRQWKGLPESVRPVSTHRPENLYSILRTLQKRTSVGAKKMKSDVKRMRGSLSDLDPRQSLLAYLKSLHLPHTAPYEETETKEENEDSSSENEDEDDDEDEEVGDDDEDAEDEQSEEEVEEEQPSKKSKSQKKKNTADKTKAKKEVQATPVLIAANPFALLPDY